MNYDLTLYRGLSRLRWPKSYLGKMQAVAFLGVHIPLLSIIVYLAVTSGNWAVGLPILIVGLCSTLLGTLLTLLIQQKVLAPVLQATETMNNYLEQGALPELPTHFTDEAGLLMAHTQLSLTQLDRLLKLKQNMLTIMAHDIRSPMTSIMLVTDLMAAELEQSQLDLGRLQRNLNKIRTATNYQLELMNHTLTLAQVEAGKLNVEITDSAAQDVLSEVFALTQLQAMAKGIDYQVIRPRADEWLQLDLAKTLQVLTNLVGNAIKFTPAGGRIELGAARQEQWIKFWVKDSGVGMEAATLATLFEPFSRAQRTGTAKEAGTGLGLWICKTFVEAQNGQLLVESQPKQGSCFTVQLPVRYASDVAAARPASEPEPASAPLFPVTELGLSLSI